LIDNHDTTPNIVVKLDIEGSEFVVLEKMITSGTIKKISITCCYFREIL
jgi:hypothetical protein